MHKIKAVIFDMDGVLIDARDWHYEALNRALGLIGFRIDRFDHLVTYDGLPTRRKLEMLTLDCGLPRDLHGFVNDMKQLYTMETVYTRCKPVFQHQYALSRLKDLGYRLVVASNSVRATMDLMMEKSDLKLYLDFTLSNQDVQKPKPDPEIYQLAAKKLQVRPDECLVLEDHRKGIESAMAAGTHVLEVPHPAFVNFESIMRRIHELERGT